MCRAPFKQLFTITAFVGINTPQRIDPNNPNSSNSSDGSENHEEMKLVPLMYVLMSTTRGTVAYEAILTEILQFLPRAPLVTNIAGVLDKDLWKAFNKVLPGVKIRVCSYYYMKALWKKVGLLLFVTCP